MLIALSQGHVYFIQCALSVLDKHVDLCSKYRDEDVAAEAVDDGMAIAALLE